MTTNENAWIVRGLRMPPTLVALLEEGRWQDPPQAALQELLPWFEDPLIFLTSAQHIRSESRSLDLFADDPRSSELFRERRGSATDEPVELPWLDVERAILIAVNRNPGDDVALALDYRSNPADPRVVASDFWTNPHQCAWRVVTDSFTEFTDRLALH